MNFIKRVNLRYSFVFFILTLSLSSSLKAQVSYGASAYYGTRLLNPSYKGSAIQVRRTCDNATKDIAFSCGALDITTLTTFVVASNPLSAISSTSAAAFSLRRLICTYAGKAINVRRSSDNATQDIGFTGSGDLDTVALKTFIGANSGFVTTWYDQSSNTRNALQATASLQPRIVNAGAIDRQNNMPAIYFPGSGYGLFTAGFTAFSSAACFNGVARVNANLTYNTIVNKTNVNFPSPLDHYNGTVVVGDGGGGGTYTFFSPSQTLNASYPLGIWTYQGASGGNVNMYHNSTSILSGTATYFGDAGNPLAIGNRNDGLTGLNGWISEVITFGVVPSNTDRLFVEWSQSQYYGISGPTLGSLPASPASGYITTWYDQSGNNVNLTQATASQQPQIITAGSLLQLQNLPTIVGSNAAQTGLIGTFASSYSGTGLTAATVFQPDISSTGNLRVMSVGTGTSTADWSNDSYFDVNERNTNQLVIERNGSFTTSNITVGSPITLTVLFNGTTNQMFNNGTGSSTTADTRTFNFNTLQVLNSINPAYTTEAMTGRMSEYHLFQSALNTTRRTLLETNQAAYYNLTISNNEYTPPAVGSYNLFVSGVGRTSATDSVTDTRKSVGMGFTLGTTATDFLKDNGDYITAGTSCPLANGSFANLPATVVKRWANDWYINKTDVNNNGGTVKIYFDFTDYGGATPTPGVAADYVLLYRSTTAGTFSIVPGTTVSVSGNRVIFTLDAANITTNYYYTLGTTNDVAGPLPIELLSFTAIPNDNKVNLKWETATEINNAYFTVEKSKDGVNFTKVIDVPGAGTTTSYKEYAETDYQPYSGVSYYRLKQTDFNGAFKYFTIVTVNFENQKNITVYPNPIDNNTGNFTVEVNGYKGQEVVVVLRDIQGREFLSKVLLSQENDQTFIVDETHSLMPGTYIVTASSNDKIYNYKLIVK